MIKQGIVALLAADAVVSGLVGTRIFPVVLPADSNDYPALTYQLVTSPRPGWTLEKKQESRATVQFDAYANSYKEADQVLAAVSDVLNGFAGHLPGEQPSARVIFAQSINDTDHFEDDSRVYRSLCEYEIKYVEPDH